VAETYSLQELYSFDCNKSEISRSAKGTCESCWRSSDTFLSG